MWPWLLKGLLKLWYSFSYCSHFGTLLETKQRYNLNILLWRKVYMSNAPIWCTSRWRPNTIVITALSHNPFFIFLCSLPKAKTDMTVWYIRENEIYNMKILSRPHTPKWQNHFFGEQRPHSHNLNKCHSWRLENSIINRCPNKTWSDDIFKNLIQTLLTDKLGR